VTDTSCTERERERANDSRQHESERDTAPLSLHELDLLLPSLVAKRSNHHILDPFELDDLSLSLL